MIRGHQGAVFAIDLSFTSALDGCGIGELYEHLHRSRQRRLSCQTNYASRWVVSLSKWTFSTSSFSNLTYEKSQFSMTGTFLIL